MKSIYKRVIIKLSGEALADENDKLILDANKLKNVALTVEKVLATGTQVGIVVGAGNIWRGRLAEKIGIEPATADYMGMLGTIINALAIQSAIEERGMSCRVMSSINVPQVAEAYIRRKATSHLSKGIVTIFAGGTGNPFFTTDIKHLTFHEVVERKLQVMDLTAVAMLEGKSVVIRVFDFDSPDSFLDVLEGKDIGTIISEN